jgi:predicted NUDIX family NTP pyrophosphohydrolase
MDRIKDGAIHALLAHSGYPNLVTKGDGDWSIPRGEPGPDEDLFLTAQREFEEEAGLKPTGPFIPLQAVKQNGSTGGADRRTGDDLEQEVTRTATSFESEREGPCG